jgi:hypothetical protein
VGGEGRDVGTIGDRAEEPECCRGKSAAQIDTLDALDQEHKGEVAQQKQTARRETARNVKAVAIKSTRMQHQLSQLKKQQKAEMRAAVSDAAQ